MATFHNKHSYNYRTAVYFWKARAKAEAIALNGLDTMDIQILLIVILPVLLLSGGGWYGRHPRWIRRVTVLTRAFWTNNLLERML